MAKKTKGFIPKKPLHVPKDLKDQMGAIEAVATAFNVLDKGYFPHSYASAVKLSLKFLAALHEQQVASALKHPEAQTIPELKSLMTKEIPSESTTQEV